MLAPTFLIPKKVIRQAATPLFHVKQGRFLRSIPLRSGRSGDGGVVEIIVVGILLVELLQVGVGDQAGPGTLGQVGVASKWYQVSPPSRLTIFHQ